MGAAIVIYLTVFEVKLRAVFPLLGSLGDINVGTVALLANIVVLVVVRFATTLDRRQGGALLRACLVEVRVRGSCSRVCGGLIYSSLR